VEFVARTGTDGFPQVVDDDGDLWTRFGAEIRSSFLFVDDETGPTLRTGYGEMSEERLRPEDRQRVVADLTALRLRFPKLEAPLGLLAVYANPPASPAECVFARTTSTISADLTTRITPCQFGGAPDCSQCGCVASAGLGAVGRHRLFGFIPVGSIFRGSIKVGEHIRRLRSETVPA